ncbi:MAG TPA: DUF368 domain-containing protein [Flavobacteriales bacterium]|jgi:putative membrane protein|nr:DUF368 domain-containing protein [Flavobacteriales bacterium]HIO59699.1 DUF368 domain-containing protein [Flavobacteriales bacterium]
MRSTRAWVRVLAKGFAMGTADLVPGVSGGTIAFITGIYDELISTIAGLGLDTLRDLVRIGPTKVWAKYNLSFLAALGLGLVCAVASLSGTLHWLQEEHSSELRAVFFGLVLASVPLIARDINPLTKSDFIWGLLGVAVAVAITTLPPAMQSEDPLFLFFCGSIAICAMLLPGISGSFILLILGAYTSVISALANFDLVRIGAFGLGALTGLIAFSRIISKVLHKFRSQTIAVLTGFLLGSLHVLWPWKNEIELLYTHSDGREEWLLGNVLPESNLVEIVIMTALVLAGIAIVTGLDLFSKTK